MKETDNRYKLDNAGVEGERIKIMLSLKEWGIYKRINMGGSK